MKEGGPEVMDGLLCLCVSVCVCTVTDGQHVIHAVRSHVQSTTKPPPKIVKDQSRRSRVMVRLRPK